MAFLKKGGPQSCLKPCIYIYIFFYLHTPLIFKLFRIPKRYAYVISGTEKVPKELVRQRFCRTFGWTFWCDLLDWVVPSNCSENSLVCLCDSLALGVFLGPRILWCHYMPQIRPKNCCVTGGASEILFCSWSLQGSGVTPWRFNNDPGRVPRDWRSLMENVFALCHFPGTSGICIACWPKRGSQEQDFGDFSVFPGKA